MAAAIWALARADALLPREFAGSIPPPLRGWAGTLAILRGPGAKIGRPGERLARTLERLGPVAIKFGQFLSTRADILGAEFAGDMGRLKDDLPAFSAEIARSTVETALGETLGGVRLPLGPAVAAASVAQAHRARLADGREVAVKILRPGIERRVAEDSAVLMLAARIAARLLPASRRLSPTAFAATVIRSLQLELDMRLEAAAADELGEIMAGDGFMRAPKVIWEAVARRVMVLEWAPGLPLSAADALAQPGLDRPAVATNLIRGFLAQALDHGVFHADLHEGNLFVRAPAEVTAVDFGIVGRLGTAERRYLAEILWGFLRQDYQRVADVHFRAGYVTPDHDPAVFAQALRAVGRPIFGRTASGLSMARLLGQLFEVTALFDMALRPELVLLQKTMVTVEGVARRIDPEHDIWRAAEPVVRRWIQRELSPSAVIRRIRTELDDGLILLRRALEARVAAPTKVEATNPWLGFAFGVLAAACAFVAAAWLR